MGTGRPIFRFLGLHIGLPAPKVPWFLILPSTCQPVNHQPQVDGSIRKLDIMGTGRPIFWPDACANNALVPYTSVDLSTCQPPKTLLLMKV